MTTVVLRGAGTRIHDIVRIAQDGTAIAVAEETRARLQRARAILETAARDGQQIYGMNTGLGANLNTPVSADFEAFQFSIIRGRGAAVGEPLTRAQTRAVMAARLSMLAVAGSGISPAVFDALVSLVNAGIHPVLPSIGSIGAGDLVLLSGMARALVGEGEVEFRGDVRPAAQALAEAGLEPAILGPKDGISLLNASAVSVGLACLVLSDTALLLDRQRQAAALSFEALGGNPSIFTAAIQQARPAPRQAEEAAHLLKQLEGSELLERQPHAIQDPLSFRCIAPVHAVAADALAKAQEIVEIELNAAADNPLVILSEERVLSTGNFHTPALSLAFETLALAVAHVAHASAARFVHLTGAGRNGLPRYLSRMGGSSAGFVPMQKTVVSLHAAIRHDANPVMLDGLPVSEGAEDLATQSVLAVRKFANILDHWQLLIACELLASAQALDFRSGHRPGSGVQKTHRYVRAIVPCAIEDRPLGDDVAALNQILR
ncbi:histidine ammonia-lyase [Rhizobium sp. CG5]|uniref:HAL/PAL/TAL family ammonia-lyase n=1 Tax=Rhizobium sp. CG5 TaxID=2726076 RepID=UPI002033C2C1|nr:aromatic amino acid lyase [Rhizobium sp. CG5]MCM2477678.1 histidine ammonia-lyase [Rhizobium sp. CG5]